MLQLRPGVLLTIVLFPQRRGTNERAAFNYLNEIQIRDYKRTAHFLDRSLRSPVFEEELANKRVPASRVTKLFGYLHGLELCLKVWKTLILWGKLIQKSAIWDIACR